MAAHGVLLAASALLLSSQQARAVGGYELTMTGFCDAKSDLEGLTFRKQGYTKSGAPWYQTVDNVGAPAYIYWDPDCPGSSDGTPRWIIDADAPNVTADRDLDGDGACQYHARINSVDKRGPPEAGQWSMECHDGWRTKFVLVLEKTSTTTTSKRRTTTTREATEPPTTEKTRKATTTEEPTHAPKRTTTHAQEEVREVEERTKKTTAAPCTGRPTPAPKTQPPTTHEPAHRAPTPAPDHAVPPPPKMVQLNGTCESKNHLNGLTYVLQGFTLAGAPYYKAHGLEEYLYHDRKCGGNKVDRVRPRWILDSDKPDELREDDLDGDGKCDYHARYDTTESAAPPPSAVWRMYCGEPKGWKDVTLTFQPVDKVQPIQDSAVVYVSAAPARRGLAAGSAALLAVSLLAGSA